MRRNILLHGFNVVDAGAGTVGQLVPHLSGQSELFSYGWVGPIRVLRRNQATVPKLAERLTPGTILIGHSNAGLIIQDVAHIYSRLGAVVLINPAMRRDAQWPEHLPVLCLANTYDYTVSAGKLFADRFWDSQGWGAAGRFGFDQASTETWFTCQSRYSRPVRGHSGVFSEAEYWGQAIDSWATAKARRF
jgi:hypothetical protein